MSRFKQNTIIYAGLFLTTGLFAILGGLYTWGKGPLFVHNDLVEALVPWGDLLMTGPLSLLAAFGLLKNTRWGYLMGLMVCGIYLFGSNLVYISLVWHGKPYPLQLALPPLAGILIGVSYPIWLVHSQAFSTIGVPTPLSGQQEKPPDRTALRSPADKKDLPRQVGSVLNIAHHGIIEVIPISPIFLRRKTNDQT